MEETLSPKIVKKVRIKNDLGLHTRPATVIVKLLQNTKSQVTFTYKKETVNAKSILSILMLAVPKNSVVSITVKGEDAEETMNRLLEAFEEQFGEKLSQILPMSKQLEQSVFRQRKNAKNE